MYLTTSIFKFDLRLTLGKKCDEEKYANFECKQPAKLEVLEKGTTNVLQTIQLDEVRAAIDEHAEAAVGQIAGYGSIFRTYAVDDYNFDGEPDLAVVRNDWGLYRGAMYTIFLWDKKKQRFVLNKPLTKLTETDILDFDPKEKLIGTTWKDGCCQHIYRYFRMVNDRPKLIYKLVLVDGDHHEERLVNGVWKRRKVTGEEDDLRPSRPVKP